MNYYRITTVILLLVISPLVGLMAQTEESRISRENPSKLIELNRSSNLSPSQSQEVLKKELTNGKQGYQFVQIGTESDVLGYNYSIFQETYEGLKVEFAVQKLHSYQGKLQTLSGDFYTVDGLDLNPAVNAETAFKNALELINAERYLWEDKKSASLMGDYQKPTGELLILPDLDNAGKVNLAYKFDIYATQPLSRDHVYVSARTGKILLVNPVIKHLGEYSHFGRKAENADSFESAVDALAVGNADTRYSGSRNITTRIINSQYALRDDTRGNGVNTYNSQRSNSYSNTNFYDNDNNWTAAEYDNANKDNGALDAHWGAESTYDYWFTVHNRNSFNGSGAAINSYVHYDDVPGGAGYDNAFWNGSVMTYGDGNNFDILTSLDVAAHEIGHAVTTFTGNMAYRRESGALNEGYSDIWGAAVEHHTRGGGTDSAPLPAVWAIGEDISSTGGLRSMSDPKSKGDPDTYRGINWVPATSGEGCSTPARQNDYCGVHSNSGVLNHWFYILVAGKTGTNDNGDSYAVNGIGMNKSAQIAYRLLRLYLSSNSTFADARTFGIRSAEELFGVGSTEVVETTNAWYAVGVGAEYGGGGGGPTACTSTISTFPYAESFESNDGWTQVSGDDGNWVRDSGGTPSSGTGPSSGANGSFYMFLEASTNGSNGQIGANATAILESDCIDLSGETTADFSFQYHMYGTSVGSLIIQTSNDNGASWTNQWSQSGNQGNNWVPVNISLDGFAGETIKIRIVGTTGSSWSSDIAVDDVKVTTGGSTGGSGCSGGGISSFPYGESFESGIGSWTQAAGDDGNWVRDANGTPSSGTGPSSAVDGSYYMFLEASTNGSTGQIGNNATAILESTCLDFSTIGTASITFGYHMYGSNMGSLELQVSTNNGGSWSTIWSESGNQGNSWLSANVSLNAYTGGDAKIRFRGTTGNGWSSDVAIDNVIISASSSLTGITDLSNEVVAPLEISIFPNPVTGTTLNVNTTNSEVSYEIINAAGQYIAKGKLDNGGINISQLTKGVYVLKFAADNKVVTKRFIRN